MKSEMHLEFIRMQNVSHVQWLFRISNICWVKDLLKKTFSMFFTSSYILSETITCWYSNYCYSSLQIIIYFWISSYFPTEMKFKSFLNDHAIQPKWINWTSNQIDWRNRKNYAYVFIPLRRNAISMVMVFFSIHMLPNGMMNIAGEWKKSSDMLVIDKKKWTEYIFSQDFILLTIWRIWYKIVNMQNSFIKHIFRFIIHLMLSKSNFC